MTQEFIGVCYFQNRLLKLLKKKIHSYLLRSLFSYFKYLCLRHTHISKVTSDYSNDDTEMKHLSFVFGHSNDKQLWELDLVE